MASNILMFISIVLLIAICAFSFYTSYVKQKYAKLYSDYEVLQNRYNSLEINYNTLERAYKAKQELHNETEQKLQDIADGSIDDSIERLQKRNRKNRNKVCSS